MTRESLLSCQGCHVPHHVGVFFKMVLTVMYSSFIVYHDHAKPTRDSTTVPVLLVSHPCDRDINTKKKSPTLYSRSRSPPPKGAWSLGVTTLQAYPYQQCRHLGRC